MTLKLYPEEQVQDIADAIRDKNGLSDTYTIGEMASAIEAIPSGGGGDEEKIYRMWFETNPGRTAPGEEVYYVASGDRDPVCTQDDGTGGKIVAPQGAKYVGMTLDTDFYVCVIYNEPFTAYGYTYEGTLELNVAAVETVFDGQIYYCAKLMWDSPAPTPVIDTTDITSVSEVYDTAIDVVLHGSESTIQDRIVNSNSVKIIRPFAAYRNNILSKVSFPNCTAIGISAFWYCSKLSNVSFPACTTIGSYAFRYCTALTNISFPACTTIGSYAFDSCPALSNVSFPNCTTIESYAFNDCSALTNLSFPVCTTIGSSAFRHCPALSNISFPNCTTIGKFAFDFCPALTNISFPVCTVIGDYAFRQCSALTSVSFPNCTTISGYAFQNCSSLEDASFPACTTIGSSAFDDCSALANVSFPACTTIGSSAFNDCSALANASFPACTAIERCAFQSCSALTNVSFPACTAIGIYAFYDCVNISTALFGALSSFGKSNNYGIFQKCSKLESLYLLGDNVVPYGGSKDFTETPITNSSYLGYYGSIYVLSSLVTAYKTASGWSSISNRITAYVE